MNERTIFKRRIQQLSKKIASDYDFTLYNRTFLIKEESDIVCMIVFDFPPTAMQFDRRAMQEKTIALETLAEMPQSQAVTN